MKLELDVVYESQHSRKGKLYLLLTDIGDEEWISGILMNQNPVKGIMGQNKWLPGENMTVRRCLCSGWKRA